jgi:hypothetical protein
LNYIWIVIANTEKETHMKTLLALAIVFTATFVLFDAVVASCVVIAAALLMLVPRDVWVAFGKAWIAAQPAIFFWTMMDS